MFKIGKEFHLLHVVNDLDAVDGWYDHVFAVRRFVRNSMKAAMRKASLVLIADFVMEPAQPLRHMQGWENSALGRFASRYGQHFHSLAWYVDDLAETCARLTERKIRLFDMVGNAVTVPSRRDGASGHTRRTPTRRSSLPPCPNSSSIRACSRAGRLTTLAITIRLVSSALRM
jgi:hypothetical protein